LEIEGGKNDALMSPKGPVLRTEMMERTKELKGERFPSPFVSQPLDTLVKRANRTAKFEANLIEMVVVMAETHNSIIPTMAALSDCSLLGKWHCYWIISPVIFIPQQ
jgi:hypothetical protein